MIKTQELAMIFLEVIHLIQLITSSINVDDKIHFEVDSDTFFSEHFPAYLTFNTVRPYHTKEMMRIKSVCTKFGTEIYLII